MTKQSIKQFLKPDWRKIAAYIVLLIIFLSFKSALAHGEFYWPTRGLPLPILVYVYGHTGGPYTISYFGLIIDLFFWYLVSCLIIFTWDKLRRKKT